MSVGRVMSRRCRRRLAGRNGFPVRDTASPAGPVNYSCERYSLTAWPDIACRRPQRVLKSWGLSKKYSAPESLKRGLRSLRSLRGTLCSSATVATGSRRFLRVWMERRARCMSGGTVSVRPEFQRAGCLRRNRHWREALRASPMDGGAPRQRAFCIRGDMRCCRTTGQQERGFYLLQCCGAEVRPGPNQASCKSQLANNVLPSCAWRSAGRFCNVPHVGRGAVCVGTRSVSIRRCPEA